ncbi:hypothetical protein CsSME_00028203 [Camellia sinensis var. sinensis]
MVGVGAGAEAEIQSPKEKTPHCSLETEDLPFEARLEDCSIDSARQAFNITPTTASEQRMADSVELTPESNQPATPFPPKHILPHPAMQSFLTIGQK